MTAKEYNEAVGAYADGLYRFILKNMGEAEDAKDVVQVSFEKLWMHRINVDTGSAKAFLFTTGYRQMIDDLRRKKLRKAGTNQQLEEATTAPHETTGRRMLQEAFEKLNTLQRALVLLKDYEGYSYAEIGVITELNESQVKVYLHRARLALRNYIVQPDNII